LRKASPKSQETRIGSKKKEKNVPQIFVVVFVLSPIHPYKSDTMKGTPTTTNTSTDNIVITRRSPRIAKSLKVTPVPKNGTRRSPRIAKRFNVTLVPKNGTRRSPRIAKRLESGSGSDVTPTLDTLRNGVAVFEMVNEGTLQTILAFVGEDQYRFVASINRSFRASYTALFPDKTTLVNATTLEMAQFCWNDIIAGCTNDDDDDDDDERYRTRQPSLWFSMWHLATKHRKHDVAAYLVEQLPDPLNRHWRHRMSVRGVQLGYLELLQFL
jgi:hypothetical protein